MGSYTTHLEDRLDQLCDEDLEPELLMEAAAQFCTFDQSLDSFILSHGYTDDINDIPSKINFLKQHFKQAGCEDRMRNIDSWYTKHARIDFKSTIYFAYAFRLNPEEYKDFCRRITLTRGLDCHSFSGAVHYFCIKNQLPYSKALEILMAFDTGLPLQALPSFPLSVASQSNGSLQDSHLSAASLPDGSELIYTDYIVNELDHLHDLSELSAWLADNKAAFTYNNVSASRNIQRLWDMIASPKGLAEQESLRFSSLFGSVDEQTSKDGPVSRIQPRRQIGVVRNYSSWDILLHILRLDRKSEYIDNTKRSLTPILNNSPLIHVLAAEYFPSRETVDKILRGNHVNEEAARKLLILLFFYQFWVRINLKNSGFDSASTDDYRSFLWSIDQLLKECHFPSLYPGNPYDWLFLYSARTYTTGSPLETFRCLMGEILQNPHR